MSEKIINIYKFILKDGQESYIYSVKKNNDHLGYDYYLLTQNEDGELEIKISPNTINLLHNNEITINPISKQNPEYKIFLEKLLTVLENNEKKEEVSLKK